MEAMENLLTRRSIRKFKPQQITDASWRPCSRRQVRPHGQGTQSPLMVAVQNAEDIAVMSRVTPASGASRTLTPSSARPQWWSCSPRAATPTACRTPHWCWATCSTPRTPSDSAAAGSTARRRPLSCPRAAPDGEMGHRGRLGSVGNCILGYADCDQPKPAPRKEGYAIVIK